MDGRSTWTDCDDAGDYGVPNVFSPRDLVFRPDNMDETVPHRTQQIQRVAWQMKTPSLPNNTAGNLKQKKSIS